MSGLNLSTDETRLPRVGLRVLLLEDDKLSAAVAIGYLMQIDDAIEVDWVESFEAAREKIKARRYDAIVADLHLPDAWPRLTGLYLRELPANLPFMVVSGKPDDIASEMVQEPRVRSWLLKSEMDATSFRAAFVEMMRVAENMP